MACGSSRKCIFITEMVILKQSDDPVSKHVLSKNLALFVKIRSMQLEVSGCL